MKYNNILEMIGNTPHLRLERLFPQHEVWMKLERQNPGGSIKDRIALAMIEAAEQSGALQPGGTIIEPTSGNTGVGLAAVGAYKGYRVIIVMPEHMSMERRQLIALYGAELVLSPKEKGMKGAIAQAEELQAQIDKAWIPMQFQNADNPAIHARQTAAEIIADFPQGFDYLIAGVGTGGHISGVGRALKAEFPHLKVIAVEPTNSPVISGGSPAPHALQGLGAGFIPDTFDRSVIDSVILVDDAAAYHYTQQLARQESILGGISTGAALAAVAQHVATLPESARVLCFNYDTGERYLSVEGLF